MKGDGLEQTGWVSAAAYSSRKIRSSENGVCFLIKYRLEIKSKRPNLSFEPAAQPDWKVVRHSLGYHPSPDWDDESIPLITEERNEVLDLVWCPGRVSPMASR